MPTNELWAFAQSDSNGASSAASALYNVFNEACKMELQTSTIFFFAFAADLCVRRINGGNQSAPRRALLAVQEIIEGCWLLPLKSQAIWRRIKHGYGLVSLSSILESDSIPTQIVDDLKYFTIPLGHFRK